MCVSHFVTGLSLCVCVFEYVCMCVYYVTVMCGSVYEHECLQVSVIILVHLVEDYHHFKFSTCTHLYRVYLCDDETITLHTTGKTIYI